MGFETPTPIQEQAIPVLLEDPPKDLIGLAQTGTGKTAAFGLPLVERIDYSRRATQALVLAPTRELGQQTAAQITEFASNNDDLNVLVVYGGAAISRQIYALKKPTHIIVATPGRLLDLIDRGAVDLSEVKYVVLDEADEMLNMGFKEDIDSILDNTLDDRVTWLFSATMPADIRKISKKYMKDPVEISVNTEHKVNKDITHQFIVTKTADKLPALRRFLDLNPNMRGVMFCRTKRLTQQLADQLAHMGYGVESLHGDLSQAQRDAVMRRFKNRSMQLLLATDVAARGIDVSDLTHVFHHTLPDQLESYTHRSGRTGRAGKKGISLAFINSREGRKIREIEKKNQVTFEKIEVPSIDELKDKRLDHWAQQILSIEYNQGAGEAYGKLKDSFESVSKEDLLQLLISRELNLLTSEEKEADDLNYRQASDRKERGRDRDGRGKRDLAGRGKDGERPERRSRPRRAQEGYNRYFINIGTVDGAGKGDLIEFITEVGSVPAKSLGQITMQKNCSYFDIEDGRDRGLGQRFHGISVKGRAIRVNRDNDDNKPENIKAKKKGKPKKTSKKRKKR